MCISARRRVGIEAAACCLTQTHNVPALERWPAEQTPMKANDETLGDEACLLAFDRNRRSSPVAVSFFFPFFFSVSG